jgi:UDP-2,4-diacetamido-2,4,6-trideoxy-beta-L-altropyranose hydrolase
MKTKLFFRVDASPQIGAGHLKRCAVLAKACLDLGGECYFLLRCQDFDWQLCGLPDTIKVIHVPWDLEPEEDAKWLVECCQKLGLRAGVLDHYRVTTGYQQCLRDAGLKWLLFGNPSHTHDILADLFHDAAPGAAREVYAARLKKNNPQFLLGPEFALVDPEFRCVRSLSPEASSLGEKLDSILLTFGGGDDRGALMKALDWLDRVRFEGQRVVLTTSMNPRLPELKEAIKEQPQTVLILDNWQPASIMAQRQLALCAGGTTLHELACLGVPAAVLAIAENQVAPGIAWQKAGLGIFLGMLTSLDESQAQKQLSELLHDGTLRQVLAQRCWKTQDGLGAERTAASLLRLAVSHVSAACQFEKKA